MRELPDAKAMAKALRNTLKHQQIDISHSQALDLVAAQLGYANWNVLAAKLASAEAEGIRFEQTAPILRIFDEAKAREFYVDFLGFNLDWEHRFGDNFPLYCQVSRAGLVLHLSGHHGDASPGSTAYVTMRGVERFQQELAGKDYTYMKPDIEALPWGKQVTVTDPFSNRIRFCEPDD